MLTAASADAVECHARCRNRLCAVSLTREALDALCTAMCDTPEQQALRIACFHHLKPKRPGKRASLRSPFWQKPDTTLKD